MTNTKNKKCLVPAMPKGTLSDRSHHTYTPKLAAILGTSESVGKFNMTRFEMDRLADYAFTYRSPISLDEITVVAVKCAAPTRCEYGRFAIVPVADLLPFMQRGLPMTWHLNSLDYPSTNLAVPLATRKTPKRVVISIPRLLFNAPEKAFMRYLWSPLLLLREGWFVSEPKRRPSWVKPALDYEKMLHIHHLTRKQIKGEGYYSFQSIEEKLLPRDRLILDHFAYLKTAREITRERTRGFTPVE